MNKLNRLGAVVAAAILLVLAGCPEIRDVDLGRRLPADIHGNPMRAFQIISPGHAMGGDSALGRVGDFRMHNDSVVVVIGSPATAGDNAGHIVDAGLTELNLDEFGGIWAYGSQGGGRRAVYTQGRILDEGRSGRDAIIEVKGHDSSDPALIVTTRYTLPATGHVVKIATEVVNTGQTDYPHLLLADVVRWGRTHAFVPGKGYELRGETVEADWLASEGRRTSYAFMTKSGGLRVTTSGETSNIEIEDTTVSPGWKVHYERYLAIGAGTAGSLLESVLDVQGKPKARLSGVVTEKGTGQPVPSAKVRVSIKKSGTLLAVFRTDGKGAFGGAVPRGVYTIRPSGWGRAALDEVDYNTDKGGELKLVLTGSGSLFFSIADEAGANVPGRLTFLGRDGTHDPDLGPVYRAAGASNLVFSGTGKGSVAVPPGKYTVVASRGPEFELAKVDVEVGGPKATEVRLKPLRAFETPGWMSVDLHQHSSQTVDCPTSKRDRVAATLAEGLDIMVSSDQNALTDFAPEVATLKAARRLKTFVGTEVRTEDIGHFGVFPLVPGPDWDPWPFEPGLDPADLFARLRKMAGGSKVIEVNHPRAGQAGYFNAMFLSLEHPKETDSRISWGFQTLEVLNGRRTSSRAQVFKEWVAALDAGERFTAVANSDSYRLAGEAPGSFRNYVRLAAADPSAVTAEALVKVLTEDRTAFMTNGPYVEVAMPKTPIGGTEDVRKERRQALKIKVWAASWVPVEKVEILGRGAKVVASWSGLGKVDKPLRFSGEKRVWIGKPGWYVVRVTGTQAMVPISDETPLAVTNPIWIGSSAELKAAPKPRPARAQPRGSGRKTPPPKAGKPKGTRPKTPAGDDELPAWLQ